MRENETHRVPIKPCSGSVLDPYSVAFGIRIRNADPDPDPVGRYLFKMALLEKKLYKKLVRCI